MRFAMLIILLLVLCAVGARGRQATFDPDRFYHFLASADHFNRKLSGCDPVGFPPAVTCIAGRGVLDVAEWHRLQAEARKVFGE